MKEELSGAKAIPYYPTSTSMIELFPNRFDQKILQRLRLSFLTSQTIRDVGGTAFIRDEVDFRSEFDLFNEECSVQFLMDAVAEDLRAHLKPREVYQQKIFELEQGGLDSMTKFQLLSLHRLHLDEIFVLEKNLAYLGKLRKAI